MLFALKQTKRFYLLLLLTAGITTSTFSQQLAPAIEWQKCLGGSNEDKASTIIKAIDGGYIITGSTKSNNGDLTAHYGSTDSTDAWVVKISATGNMEWQRNYGGDGMDEFKTIIRTNDGNYVCFGTTTSNNGDVSGNHGRTDLWVIKIDRQGDIIWKKVLGGSSIEIAGNIRQNVDGTFFLIGSTLEQWRCVGSS
jgi:hypothetical protein